MNDGFASIRTPPNIEECIMHEIFVDTALLAPCAISSDSGVCEKNARRGIPWQFVPFPPAPPGVNVGGGSPRWPDGFERFFRSPNPLASVPRINIDIGGLGGALLTERSGERFFRKHRYGS